LKNPLHLIQNNCQIISRVIIVYFFLLSFISCNRAPKSLTGKHLSELSAAEMNALDALDMIQLSGHHVYSTFANIDHECEEPTNNFKISQEEFADAMMELLVKYYQDKTEEEQIRLVNIVSKAQSEYSVKTCGATPKSVTLDQHINPHRSGIWIFQSLLDRRDLIIKW